MKKTTLKRKIRDAKYIELNKNLCSKCDNKRTEIQNYIKNNNSINVSNELLARNFKLICYTKANIPVDFECITCGKKYSKRIGDFRRNLLYKNMCCPISA